jgi:putative SOS response-associated peptidase YedK
VRSFKSVFESQQEMCGRAAQTQHTVTIAASSLLGRGDGASTTTVFNRSHGGTTQDDSSSYNNRSNINKQSNDDAREWHDNYNMSPGMDATVFWMDGDHEGTDGGCIGTIQMGRKYWGLVVKPGTERTPLPPPGKERMALHFNNLMYNARTDTLFSKPTFSRLTAQGKSCIVALDGYFEWKSSPLAGGKGKKQPHYVYRRRNEQDKETLKTPQRQQDQPFLLLAGLWTRVKTGIPEEPFLDTFTILTTEANSSIQWLHHRMPVCIWDLALAREWLNRPTEALHQTLDQAAKQKTDGFEWHMVTTEMSSVKFRDQSAIKSIPKPKSVLSYFTSTAPSCDAMANKSNLDESLGKNDQPVSETPQQLPSDKREIEDLPSPTRSSKKRSATTPLQQPTAKTKQKLPPATKGTISSFFSPKKSAK